MSDDVVAEETYEAPVLVEVGDFAELTRGGQFGLPETASRFEM